jgi:hypothetical protein
MKREIITSVGARVNRKPKRRIQITMKNGGLPLAWIGRAAAVWLFAGFVLQGGSLWAQTPPDSGLLNQQQRREERLQEFLRNHSDSTGLPRPDLLRKAIADTRNMTIATSIGGPASGITPNLAAPAPCGQWTQIGPAPLRIDSSQYQGLGPDSGQVTDIAIDPRNTSDQVIYISANDGGIWRSSDGGATWQPKTDFMPSLSMGAVALDPGNPSIVYAGTGNSFNNGFFKGVGIYRSTDMGDNWVQPAGNSLLNDLAINRIVLPAAGVLLVGTSSGLFKSVDGGDHYGNNPPAFDNGSAIIPFQLIDDIDLDTATAGTVYACVDGVGLVKSTDSGTTFGASIFDANVPTVFGYLSFAQSRNPNNQTMCANIDTPGDGGKIFKSSDGGTTWAELPNGSAKTAGCQCGYDQTVGIDPLDAKRIYIAFQQLFESKDGGATFALISGTASTDKIHWDHHAMVFSPHLPGSAPTRVYLGTDGGISYTENDGTTFANINEGIATCLFRGIDIGRGSAANRQYTYGGCQDTGTDERRPGFPANDWHLSIDGDGGPVVTDWSDPNRTYGSDDQYFIFTANGGVSWNFPSVASTGLPDGGGGFASAFPVGIDQNNHAVVYVKNGTKLFQSVNTGASFTSIHTFASSVLELATTALDSNTLWVSLSGGGLQRTANALAGAGSTWTPITVTGAPLFADIGGIAIDPADVNQVVVVYTGFSGVDPVNRTKHVFRTTDNGVSWTDISGTDGALPFLNLPDIPLNDVVIDPATTPHTIIVASDAAVMRTADLGATWQVLGVGLPTVFCSKVALDATATPPLLRVGTYGRSVFELTPAPCCNLVCPADINQANDPGLCGAIVHYPLPTTTGACGSVTSAPPSGSFFSVGSTTVTAFDTTGASCTFTVTVKDLEPPTVTDSVALPLLWPANHNLLNVGLTVIATDNCGITNLSVAVFGNEDDEMPTGDGNFSPDAKDIASGTLRLRAERRGDGPGRVYLIVAKATDSSGNVSFACCTVVVPHEPNPKGVAAVNTLATAAKAYCDAHNGAPPPGYFVIGDGPIIGPKQ